jgi:hypothetical protein
MPRYYETILPNGQGVVKNEEEMLLHILTQPINSYIDILVVEMAEEEFNKLEAYEGD